MILEWVAASALAAAPITLEEVREESRRNAQVMLSMLEQERVESGVTATRSSIYPQLALNASAGGRWQGPYVQVLSLPSEQDPNVVTQMVRNVDNSFSTGSFDLNLTVSQLLYDGGRWWSAIAQAGAAAAAQAGQTEEQALASELEGVRRFYALLRAQQVMVVLEANVARSEQQVERSRALFDAGRAQKTDVFAAEVNLGNDRLTVIRQRAAVVEAQTQLAAWIARDATEQWVAQTPEALGAAPQPAPPLSDALDFARAHRPLLRALVESLRASEASISVAQSGYWPRVSLRGTAGRNGPTADPFFTDITRQNYAQGGVVLDWNLFNGFSTNVEVQQARIGQRRAEVELTQGQRELEGEVRSALAQLETRIEAQQVSELNVRIASNALQLAQGQFEAGAASTLEVRDAQLKLTQAELDFLQNRIDVEIARAAVERVLGGGVSR